MKRLLLLLCFYSFLNAAIGDGVSFSKEYDLKKDEFKVIKVKIEKSTKYMTFRWTLFKNEGLVMHARYDGHPYQFVLYQKYKRESFKLHVLAQKDARYNEQPYFLITFKDYFYDTLKAKIDIKFFASDRFDAEVSENKA